MNNPIFIYGASGHGKVVHHVCQGAGLDISGFIDDNSDLVSCLGLSVQHRIEQTCSIVLGIGRNKVRKVLFEKHKNLILDYVAHPSSIIAEAVEVRTGTVIMPSVVINPATAIGHACIINTSSIIEHDCNVGDFAHISPGAILCGGVKVGDMTQIGAGAVVLPGITIGDNCVIGAGAVVTRDVGDDMIMVGNPAKPLQHA